MCLEMIVYSSIWFVVGWMIRSISVAKIVRQAQHDIQHVNELKHKEYKRGWNTGFGYGSGYEK